NGDLTFEADETFFVNLTTPGNATISDNQGQGTITNDDGQPTITINDVTVGEAGGNAVFTVTLSNPSYQTITVAYTTANNTATDGHDYTTTSGTLTFNPLATTQTINVPIKNDTKYDPGPAETIFINLSTPTNSTNSDNQGD